MTTIRNIEFSPPDITQEEIDEVVATLKSGWITTGPRTKEFEKQIANYLLLAKAVCLNSATAAMELTLRFLGIGPGDEVITSAYTYSASAAVIEHVGAKIVLIDTAPDSYEMDYNALEKAINEKTKAVIPVDVAGVMCDYDEIKRIVSAKSKLFKANNERQRAIGRVTILSDAAHSFGAVRNGVKSGQAADITCFSFHAVKNLTTAEGGAVVWTTNFGLTDDQIYREYMLLSLHGQSKDALSKMKKGSWEYDIVYPGFKCNMTDILAALGLVQFKRYPELLEKRHHFAKMYEKLLDKKSFRVIKHKDNTFASSAHLMLVRVNEHSELQRNALIQNLAEFGISTNVHYKPLPMFTAYKKLGFNILDFPNAFKMYENEITLPLHTLLSDEDIEYICSTLNRIVLKEDN